MRLRKLVTLCFKEMTAVVTSVYGNIGIVQKIELEIRPDLGCTTIEKSRKVVSDNPSVCLSHCPLFCRSLTGVSVNRSK